MSAVDRAEAAIAKAIEQRTAEFYAERKLALINARCAVAAHEKMLAEAKERLIKVEAEWADFSSNPVLPPALTALTIEKVQIK